MKDSASKAFVQAYNGKIAVDCATQIILSADVTQDANDKKQPKPVVGKIRYILGRKPDRVLADCGYKSEDNIVHIKKTKWSCSYAVIGKNILQARANSTRPHPQ